MYEDVEMSVDLFGILPPDDVLEDLAGKLPEPPEATARLSHLRQRPVKGPRRGWDRVIMNWTREPVPKARWMKAAATLMAASDVLRGLDRSQLRVELCLSTNRLRRASYLEVPAVVFKSAASCGLDVELFILCDPMGLDGAGSITDSTGGPRDDVERPQDEQINWNMLAVRAEADGASWGTFMELLSMPGMDATHARVVVHSQGRKGRRRAWCTVPLIDWGRRWTGGHDHPAFVAAQQTLGAMSERLAQGDARQLRRELFAGCMCREWDGGLGLSSEFVAAMSAADIGLHTAIWYEFDPPFKHHLPRLKE